MRDFFFKIWLVLSVYFFLEKKRQKNLGKNSDTLIKWKKDKKKSFCKKMLLENKKKHGLIKK